MSSLDSTQLPARAFLEHLLGLSLRDEIAQEITAWLRANPPAVTLPEIIARVDDALAGWYAALGDPRPLEARREQLVQDAQQVFGEGRGVLGTRAWLLEWLETPSGQLHGGRPRDLLETQQGFERLKEMLRADDPDSQGARDDD